MLRALIADDEEHARSRMRRLLERDPGVTIVAEASSGSDALALARANDPDVALLDVDMPGLDGLALTEALGDLPVVLVTAHARCAADAFDLDVVDFIVKPVTAERLSRALDRVRRRVRGAPAGPSDDGADRWRLSVLDGSRVRLFDARAITRLFANEKYVAFVFDSREHLMRDTLNDLEERLGAFGFVRVHRGELVRLDAIVSLESSGDSAIATLTDGQRALVSRRYVAELRRRLGVR
jgi:two-component system response regulator AlgR